MLAALNAEEVRLQRLLNVQTVQLKEAEQRLQMANEPLPHLGEYTTSLEESVLVEARTREAEAEAKELRERMGVLRQRLGEAAEVHRAQQGRLRGAEGRLAQLAPDNAALRAEVAQLEGRIGRARGEYERQSAAYRASVSDLRQGARATEATRGDLEVEVSRLEAEVRWYRLRCGEEVPDGPNLMPLSRGLMSVPA